MKTFTCVIALVIFAVVIITVFVFLAPYIEIILMTIVGFAIFINLVMCIIFGIYGPMKEAQYRNRDASYA